MIDNRYIQNFNQIQRAFVDAGFVIAGKIQVESTETPYHVGVSHARSTTFLLQPKNGQRCLVAINAIEHHGFLHNDEYHLHYNIRVISETVGLDKARTQLGIKVDYNVYDDYLTYVDAQGNKNPLIPALQQPIALEAIDTRGLCQDFICRADRNQWRDKFNTDSRIETEYTQYYSDNQQLSASHLVGWATQIYQAFQPFLLSGKFSSLSIRSLVPAYVFPVFDKDYEFLRSKVDLAYLHSISKHLDFPFSMKKAK